MIMTMRLQMCCNTRTMIVITFPLRMRVYTAYQPGKQVESYQ